MVKSQKKLDFWFWVKVNFDINAVGVYDARNQEVISW